MPGLKSIASHLVKAYQAELQALHYLRTKRQLKLLKQRFKTPFAELDFILQKKTGAWVVVEVKTLSRIEYLGQRVSETQKMRLRRACEHLIHKYKKPVELWFAFVTPQGGVFVFEHLD